MPGSNDEYVGFATQLHLPVDFPTGQTWLDGSEITDQEASTVEALWIFHRQQLVRKKCRRSQVKAMRLLRRFLTPLQEDSLRRKGEFCLTLASGNSYRLDARRGRTEQVTRHGQRWFVRRRFCLHEQSLLMPPMPPADLALTHLLLLLADEREFIETANATEANDMLWNGQWLRRLREARRVRETANTCN